MPKSGQGVDDAGSAAVVASRYRRRFTTGRVPAVTTITGAVTPLGY